MGYGGAVSAAVGPEPLPLRGVARVTGAVSSAVAGVAWVIALLCGIAIVAAMFGNVVRREFTGQSIYGAEEFARFAFLWLIWMGVSLAVRRGAITVITIVSERGAWWWRASVHALASGALGLLLVYACWRSVEYVTSPGAVDSVSAALRWPMWIPIASMTIGYFFITAHYLHAVVLASQRTIAGGRERWRSVWVGALGGLVLAALLWLMCEVLLEAGVSPLIPLGLLFIALTLAGMPVVFMLSFVGILGAAGFLGLTFFEFGGQDPLFPFRATQTGMGLSAGSELIVIFLFLFVAEVMNASGLSQRLVRAAASVVGHFRGGMAYVCQLTSAVLSGISGSAQADAAVMTPVLVPAMEKEGYRRDVAAAVVAGASIKGPVGPISIMYIAYGFIVAGPGAAPIDAMLVTGILMVTGLLLLQGLVVSIVVRRIGMAAPHPFLGWGEVARSGLSALPVLLIPFIILGGILSGFFTPVESAAVAVVVTLILAVAYRAADPRTLARAIVLAATETGIVMLLLGDSNILARLLFVDGFGQDLQEFLTGITTNPHVFMLLVIGILLLVGMFIEPLPALFILAPFLAPLAASPVYDIDPVQFAVVVVLSLVLGLIHPPVGLVLFLVSSISKVSFERLSYTLLPWLGISLLMLITVSQLPAGAITWLADWVLG